MRRDSGGCLGTLIFGLVMSGSTCAIAAEPGTLRTPAKVKVGAPAQARIPSPSAHPTWIEVIRDTQSSGTPALLIVTSSSAPESKHYCNALLRTPAIAGFQGKVGIAELDADVELDQIKRLAPKGYPMLIAYRRGPEGRLEMAGSHQGGLSAEVLSGWLLGLGLHPDSTSHSKNPPRVVSVTGIDGEDPSQSDRQVERTQYYPPTGPSPQQPMYYPPQPPKTAPYAPEPAQPRVVYRPRPAAPRVVYKKVAPPRQVVTRRVRVVPREEVEVVEVPRRRVVREIEEPAPRSLLTQPREVEEEMIEVREIEAPAPREVEEEVVEVREIEAPAPREVVEVREVEAPRREVVRVREVEVPATRAYREAEAPGEVALIQPGFLDRFVGRIGRGLAVRANPRVAVETRQEVVTVASTPRSSVVIAAPRAAASPCKHPHCHGTCSAPAPQPYTPPPAYNPPQPYLPPYAPSPQHP